MPCVYWGPWKSDVSLEILNAQNFDELFSARAQREGFRRYLEGLLPPAERNETLTALANTEPVLGAQRKEAQSLQCFLSESGWEPDALNGRRVGLLRSDPLTAPDEEGALVIDEHGDRKWGKKTAHVGRQWLGNIGKVDNGVVSVSGVWAATRGCTTPWRSSPRGCLRSGRMRLLVPDQDRRGAAREDPPILPYRSLGRRVGGPSPPRP
jgi:SRSO17 transposase